MNFIILADKYQKGMKSKGCTGLLQINRKYNLLDFQYTNIKRHFPKCTIIYVYGFDHKKLSSFVSNKKYKDLISIYNPDYQNYNYTHTLNIASNYLNDNCFITFGDIMFKYQAFDNFSTNAGSQIFINTKIKNKLGCTIQNNTINHISFDLDNYLSNIYYLTKKDANTLKKIIGNSKLKNYFIFEIINKMIDNNTTFKPFVKNNKNITHNISELKVKI